MPAERANGRFAIRPIHIVPRNDARQVASRTAVGFMPAALKMFGLTARIYAIVIKVVTPAMHSVLMLVLFSLR